MSETRDRPKPYHHGDLRYALIQAGLELLAEGGTATLDLRRVARKVGVSHAAPYRHFADKQALIAAMTEVGFQQLTARIQTTLAEAPQDAFGQLYAMARAYVHFAAENPHLMREMFSGLTIERETFPELHAAWKSVYTLFAGVIQRGQENGHIVAGEPTALAGVLWSVLHGLAILTIENQMRPYTADPEGIDNVTLFSMRLLYDGLKR